MTPGHPLLAKTADGAIYESYAVADEMIDSAMSDLETEVENNGRGCQFELWTARANESALRIADGLPAIYRIAFLQRAEAKGFYEPNSPAGWTLKTVKGPHKEALCAPALCEHGRAIDDCLCGTLDTNGDW